MEIILPEKKPSNRKTIFLAAALAFGLGVGATFLLLKPALPTVPALPAAAPAKPVEDAEDRKYHAEIGRLEGEIDRYYDAMMLAEELGDKKRYIEIVSGAAKKNLEADTAWFEWQAYKKKKGMMAEGVKQAVMEMPPLQGFTNEDKFTMLADEHGLPAEKLRALKAEIEVLFWDELIEKFGPAAAPGTETLPEGESAPQ